VREGDLISITVEDYDRRLYRIALDRYVREREEQKTREKLRVAPTDSEAEQELTALSRLTRRRPRELAQQELLRIAQQSPRRPRPRVSPGATERHEGVPSGIRVLLRELHDGKCQLCSFTSKRGTGSRTLKYTISTLTSAIIQATCWWFAQTVTHNSSMRQSPISSGSAIGSSELR